MIGCARIGWGCIYVYIAVGMREFLCPMKPSGAMHAASLLVIPVASDRASSVSNADCRLFAIYIAIRSHMNGRGVASQVRWR